MQSLDMSLLHKCKLVVKRHLLDIVAITGAGPAINVIKTLDNPVRMLLLQGKAPLAFIAADIENPRRAVEDRDLEGCLRGVLGRGDLLRGRLELPRHQSSTQSQWTIIEWRIAFKLSIKNFAQPATVL